MALASCNASQAPEFQGGLYFGQGAYVMRYSLQDGSLSVEGHLGDTVIREVSAFDRGHLLIAESASINGRRVPRISWFDVKTGESVDLYAGVLVHYLEDARVIVYDDGSELYAVPRRPGADNFVIISHEKKQLTRMIEATPGILLFETGGTDQAVIHSWNARTGELQELDALTITCRLHGALWIDTLQRLACKRRADPLAEADYVLADLDGAVHGMLELPADKQFLALAYIEGQEALVLQEIWRSMLGTRDQYAVWMYDINTGDMQHLADDVRLGNTVVYSDF